MHPGGVTELIWHFLGYLEVRDEIERPQLLYDGSVSHAGQHDSRTASAPAKAPGEEPEDVLSTRIRPPTLNESQIDSIDEFPVDLSEFPPAALSASKLAAVKSFVAPPPLRLSLEGQVVSDDGVFSVTYAEGGDDKLIDILQHNEMSDGDVVLDGGASPVGLNPVDVPGTLNSMLGSAAEEVPDDLVITNFTSQNILDFVLERDAGRAADGGANDGDAAPGRYVNGELDNSEEPQAADTGAEGPQPLLGNGSINSGLEAALGGNAASNGIAILDVNEAVASIVVLGDYFESNAIVQTNVFQDNDKVAVGGDAGERTVVTDQNNIDNIADFITTEMSVKAGKSFTWHVDTVEGDFFDVKALKQTNWMIDGDAAVQTTFTSYYLLRTGENEQSNISYVFDWGKEYDLIVVGGNYHEANWIFQTNILLDDDFVKVVTARGDTTSQSVTAGDNTLVNDATIENIGGGAFQELTPDINALIEAIENKTLDSSFVPQVLGFGPTIDILYVSGNYYDINVISQTNVVADADTAIQFLPDYMREGTTSVQEVSTGGNVLKNIGIIVDVGAVTDAQYLGGDYYDDAVLVQANIISNEEDEVVYGDTDTLVAEVIAFTAPDEEQNEPIAPVKFITQPDDVMGNVMV